VKRKKIFKLKNFQEKIRVSKRNENKGVIKKLVYQVFLKYQSLCIRSSL